MREPGPLRRAEALVGGEHLGPGAVRMVGRRQVPDATGLERRDDAIERCLRRILDVPQVPDEHERPVRGEHARDLGERSARLEPVERLRHAHGVQRGAGERDLLRASCDHPNVGHVALELRAHAGQRLDGDDLVAAGGERDRQLAGTRSEVEDATSGRELGAGAASQSIDSSG